MPFPHKKNSGRRALRFLCAMRAKVVSHRVTCCCLKHQACVQSSCRTWEYHQTNPRNAVGLSPSWLWHFLIRAINIDARGREIIETACIERGRLWPNTLTNSWLRMLIFSLKINRSSVNCQRSILLDAFRSYLRLKAWRRKCPLGKKVKPMCPIQSINEQEKMIKPYVVVIHRARPHSECSR